MDIVNKTKEIFKKDDSPITANKAKMLAIVGSICTQEERFNDFISEVNEDIMNKAKYSEFYHLMVLPMDLVPKWKEIKENFTQRGFIVHEVIPSDKEIYVISWKKCEDTTQDQD